MEHRRTELIDKRRRSLLSQIDVARKVGVSQTYYSLIERGYYDPSDEVASKLTDMFGLETNYFERNKSN